VSLSAAFLESMRMLKSTVLIFVVAGWSLSISVGEYRYDVSCDGVSTISEMERKGEVEQT
jgi:hypothetical protein